MTKEELSQLCDLRREIRELDEEVKNLKEQKRVVRDKVQSSMKDFPYVRTTATVYSVDKKADKARRRKLTDKEILLLKRRRQAADLELKISEYIQTVSDSKIRRIIHLKYEQGKTWEEVATIMHCDRTYPEKMLTKYLQNKKGGFA